MGVMKTQLKPVLALCLGVISCAAPAAILHGDALAIGFADASAGYAITSVVNRAAGVRFVHGPAKGATFWEATFWKEGAPGDAKAGARLTNLSPCRARRMEPRADGGAAFVWEGFDLPGEPGSVTVRATVRFTAEGHSAWALEVQSAAVAYGLAETRYPVLSHVTRSGEADVLQPRPDLGARLVKDREWGRRVQVGCMGYAPMMTAFLKDGAGLYVAAHDSAARIKTLVLSSEHDVSFTTPVENAGLPGKAAEGPRHEVTVAAFSGDWWAAARLYRAWALTAPWTAKGRIVDRADYPRRVAEIPLWLNIHGSADEVSNAMARVRAQCPAVDGGIHWHLWQHSGHDVNYPEYFPEQPGVRECLAFCRSIGEEAMPYTNGRLWSQPLASFPYARPYAIALPDGAPVTERYGKLTPPLSPMCPWTPQWDATVNDFAGRVLDLGAGSLFLDQIGACAGRACYNPAHGHPVGGGSWYFQGYQRLLAKVHARYSAKGAFLTTEGSGEQWMNVVDGYLTVTQRQPDDVPFFHAVYGGYTTWFCSPENHEDDLDTFWGTQARELLWGQALGWYHPLILDKPDKCALLNRLVAFRQANLDCLAYGELLGEAEVLDPVPDQPLTWLGRKRFYMWKVPDAPLSPTITGAMPGVVAYAWRSAQTGETGLLVANARNAPVRVRVKWDGAVQTVDLAARDLRRLRTP